jgi:hypothetical protein
MIRRNYTATAMILVIVLLAGALLAGCGKVLTESDVSYAGPLLDNMLSGIRDKDYREFSKDFGAEMKTAMTEDAFNTLVDTLSSKIGDYQSRAFGGATTQASNGKNYTVVVYKAKYSTETADVLITVTFGDDNGAKTVDGFFLNSPNLRK